MKNMVPSTQYSTRNKNVPKNVTCDHVNFTCHVVIHGSVKIWMMIMSVPTPKKLLNVSCVCASLLGVCAGNCQRGLVSESGMIRTQMMHNIHTHCDHY
jgi:hypothetical protein